MNPVYNELLELLNKRIEEKENQISGANGNNAHAMGFLNIVKTKRDTLTTNLQSNISKVLYTENTVRQTVNDLIIDLDKIVIDNKD